MSLRTGTICSKHEAIAELAGKIAQMAEDIETHAGHCLDDGQRMEAGLDKKRERIEELESQVEGLERANRDLERERDEQAEVIRELRDELRAAQEQPA